MTDIRTRFLSDEEAARLYDRHPQLGESPDKYCPTCGTTGKYTLKGIGYHCDCEMQLQLHKHYLNAGIGVIYQRLSWDDLENEQIKRTCTQYLEAKAVDRGMGWFCTGPFGTGKTMAANLMLKDLVKEGYNCYATTFSSMIETYTAGWRDKDDRRYFTQKVINSDVLLLDDLGKELCRSNKLSESTFDDVLRTRVQEGRATLITTNMTWNELGQGYGAAVLSLLQEVSLKQEFTGDDFRERANDRLLSEVLNGEVRPIV